MGLLTLMLSSGLGCSSTYVRAGSARTLPTGEPQTACESSNWHELAPVTVRSHGFALTGASTVLRRGEDGLAVVKVGEKQPTELTEVWPRMEEPTLSVRHQVRIDPITHRERKALRWALGSLGGMFAGFGIAAAVQEHSGAVAAGFGVGGLAIGIVGVVMTIATKPSLEDELYAQNRRFMLIPGEDDIEAAERGVSRMNSMRRVWCEVHSSATD